MEEDVVDVDTRSSFTHSLSRSSIVASGEFAAGRMGKIATNRSMWIKERY